MPSSASHAPKRTLILHPTAESCARARAARRKKDSKYASRSASPRPLTPVPSLVPPLGRAVPRSLRNCSNAACGSCSNSSTSAAGWAFPRSVGSIFP
eukprot:1750444-Prymnesium_polylepis.1